MRNLLVAAVVSLGVLGGCGAEPVSEEQGSAANAITDPEARAGEDGRDGYLMLERITDDPKVSMDDRYAFVGHNRFHGQKDTLRHGDWITAIIPSYVAAEIAAGGELSASVYLVYSGNGAETNRDERVFERQEDGSYAAKSFTIPGTPEAGPRTLSARLVASTKPEGSDRSTFSVLSRSEIDILTR